MMKPLKALASGISSPVGYWPTDETTQGSSQWAFQTLWVTGPLMNPLKALASGHFKPCGLLAH